MADADTTEVKDVERVEIQPAEEGSETIEAGGTAADSSQQNEGDQSQDGSAEGQETGPDGKPEALHKSKPAPVVPAQQGGSGDGLADVPGETPRERALRAEVTTLKGKLRQERKEEILGNEIAPPQREAKPRELSEDKKKVLAKYKPEELASLREVMPILAEELGYVRNEELQTMTYADTAQASLDGFLDKHPEYLPENDKDGTLWKQFGDEFKLYAKPTNPKDYAKIFERVHQTVFGIQPAGKLPNNQAQIRKVQSASHAGASSQAGGSRERSAGGGRQAAAEGMRFDMLKGFSEDELEELQNSAG